MEVKLSREKAVATTEANGGELWKRPIETEKCRKMLFSRDYIFQKNPEKDQIFKTRRTASGGAPGNF